MRTCVCAVLAGVVLATDVIADDGAARISEEPYVFTLDGEPFAPTVHSLHGTPETPRQGDVIVLRDIPLTLGAERRCRFKMRPELPGDHIFLVTDSGEERVIGAQISHRCEEDRIGLVNPLSAMSGAQIRGLWGVVVSAWSDEIATQMQRIDPARTAVRIEGDAVRDMGIFLRLPPNVAYLTVRCSACEYHPPLGRFRRLLYLDLDTRPRGGFNAKTLRDCPNLRYLRLKGSITHMDALASLSAVRVLDLEWVTVLADISFAADMPELRRLNIRGAFVADLTLLRRLDKLEWIDANGSPVRHLPMGGLPSLKHIALHSANLSEDDVTAFKAAHPECAVDSSWGELFHRAVAGSTRISIRHVQWMGPHRAERETHVEIDDDAEVKALIEHTEIDDAESGFYCMCAGDTFFEFYDRETLLAQVSFHHGRSLRWHGWRGDALLSRDSAEFYCRMLARHGIEGPGEERRLIERAEAALKRRVETYRKILSQPFLAEVEAASDPDAVAAVFMNRVPDATERGALYFKLLGCHEDSWNLYAGLDDALTHHLLPGLPAESRVMGARAVIDDPAGANGAARWFFGHQHWDELVAPAALDLLPKLAKRALSHPRAIARLRTISALGEIKGEVATGLLRSVLAGEVKVRQLPDEEEDEPGGTVEATPKDWDPSKDWSDQACAARVLAKLGDTQSTERIRRLAEKAEGDDKELYQEALKILESAR